MPKVNHTRWRIFILLGQIYFISAWISAWNSMPKVLARFFHAKIASRNFGTFLAPKLSAAEKMLFRGQDVLTSKCHFEWVNVFHTWVSMQCNHHLQWLSSLNSADFISQNTLIQISHAFNIANQVWKVHPLLQKQILSTLFSLFS